MLVLTRRRGQVVRIGDEVEIVLLSVQGDQVRLGINAPQRVAVVRGELLDQVREENRAAAQASALLGKRPVGNGARALKRSRKPADTRDGRARRRPVGFPSDRRLDSAQIQV